MSEEEKFTLDEAQLKFAKQTNGRVWQLLGQSERTADENEELVEAAYASLYHWRYAGKQVHRQRGEWILAHVFTVLGQGEAALDHAQRCLKLTNDFKEQMKDFDLAYAYEGIARALALGGERSEAVKYLGMAQAAGEQIANAEDKEIFIGDLKGGDWHGIR